MSRPSFQAPLVAFRGLWDKFAAPGSLAAISRAYLRGVPCVLRTEEAQPTAFEVCALVNDHAINRRGLPLYLATEAQRACGVRALSRWTAASWVPCGVYVPAASTASPLDINDFVRLGRDPAAVVLVESFNTLEFAEEARLTQDRSDDHVLTRVQAMTGPSVRVLRVSDYVELDQLERQRCEVA